MYSNAFAYRIGNPKTFTDLTKPDEITELNELFKGFWDITNGRYSLDIVTTNPDGVTTGDVGDMLLLNDSGTYYLCINVDGGTTWRSEALSDTP